MNFKTKNKSRKGGVLAVLTMCAVYTPARVVSEHALIELRVHNQNALSRETAHVVNAPSTAVFQRYCGFCFLLFTNALV